MTIEELRTERSREQIGPQLAELLNRVVTATAPTYPASAYSESATWDEASLQDALQDWVLTRLVERRDLDAMLAGAPSVKVLQAMLTTSFGQFLTNRRRRSSASNLYKRSLAILRTDARFRPVGTGHGSSQLFTTSADQMREPSSKGTRDLLEIAWEKSDLKLGVVRYGPTSLKSSPILRDPELGDFLFFLLWRAEGALDMATIAEVIRRRFNLLDLAPAELSEAVSSPELSIVRQVEIRDQARSVLKRLGLERVQTLRQYQLAKGDFAAAAKGLSKPVAQVRKEISEVMQLVAEYAESIDEARAVYDQVVESLF